MTFGGFEIGNLYTRKTDLHERFGGQRQGGISTPASHSVIFLITGEVGEQHGYADGWSQSGSFMYFGEGQFGDMEWRGGNTAIRDHVKNGKDLLLFQHGKKGKPIRFMGQFVCAGWHYQEAPDSNKAPRRAIVFELVAEGAQGANDLTAVPESLASNSLPELRKRALLAINPPSEGTPKERTRIYYQRSNVVRTYVLRRADGRCERCNSPAPFKTKDAIPYLEPHHIRRLSDGGPDDPRFMAALCPNCHRLVHYSGEGKEANVKLQEAVSKKEGNLT
jgi:5-methylcytosine-specific restriction protein A